MVCDIIVDLSKLSFVAESFFSPETANVHGLWVKFGAGIIWYRNPTTMAIFINAFANEISLSIWKPFLAWFTFSKIYFITKWVALFTSANCSEDLLESWSFSRHDFAFVVIFSDLSFW